MTSAQIQELRSLVQNADELPATAKDGLLELLAQAEHTAADNEIAAPEQTSAVLSSVEEIEANHPEATSFVNRAATILANMGI